MQLLIKHFLAPFQRLQNNSKGDKTIWILISLLWILSILIVYSAVGFMAINSNIKSSTFLFKQIIFIGIGFGVVYMTHKTDYMRYFRFTFLFYVICVLLLLITLIWGEEINGAKRWLHIPFVNIRFQPSDFAKIAMVMFVSKQISQYQKHFESYTKFFFVFIFPILLVAFLIIPENLSTGILLIIIGFLLLFIGRVQLKYLIQTIIFGFVCPLLIIIGIATHYYDSEKHVSKKLPTILQIDRIPTWIKRIQNYMFSSNLEENYQNQQAKIAISRGKFFGLGPGNSKQRYFLPSSYADFVYSILIEEYGLLGGIIIITIYLWFFVRCIKIFMQCEYAFGAFVVVGLSLTIVFQALINILVNVGLIPNTGVTLPLISMGGTSYLVSCFAIGVILSVVNKTIKEKNEIAHTDNHLQTLSINE